MACPKGLHTAHLDAASSVDSRARNAKSQGNLDEDCREEQDADVTGGQKSLAIAIVFLIPAIVGTTLPGGVVAQSTDLGFEDVLIAMWPWATSIALATWFVARNQDSDNHWGVLGGAAACIVGGAFLAFAFVPEFELTASQAAGAQYYLLAETRPDMVVRGGQVVAHSPKAAILVLVFGILATILFIYGTLYGPELWIAGVAAGAWAGMMLFDAFPGARA